MVSSTATAASASARASWLMRSKVSSIAASSSPSGMSGGSYQTIASTWAAVFCASLSAERVRTSPSSEPSAKVTRFFHVIEYFLGRFGIGALRNLKSAQPAFRLVSFFIKGDILR